MKKRKGRKALFDADYVTLMKKAGGICLGKRKFMLYECHKGGMFTDILKFLFISKCFCLMSRILCVIR